MIFLNDILLTLESGRTLFQELNLTMHTGERIAVMGQNGAGKSTLMKVISGEIEADSGQIRKEGQLKVAFLKQEPELNPDLTLEEAVVAKLTEDDPDHGVQEHDIRAALNLFKVDQPGKRVSECSGGEVRRADLARVMASGANLFILDEPTNHLDFDGIEYLIKRLRPTTCLFISHDRYFIDALATRIVEIDDQMLYSYDAPSSSYIQARTERLALNQRIHARRKNILKREVEWLRRGPPARTTKSKSRIERTEQLIEDVHALKQKTSNKKLKITDGESDRLAKTILNVEHLTFGYPNHPCGHLEHLIVKEGERWGIIGPNGVGKSTFIKTFLGQLKPLSGTFKLGNHVQFGVIDQHRRNLDASKNIQDNLTDGSDFVFIGDNKIHVCTYLDNYLFSPSDRKKPITHLSGGEQARLSFAKLMLETPNFIVLDEPTNDLDFDTQGIIEDTLLEQKGVSFIVSHDRHFLNRVCTGIIGFLPAPADSPYPYALHVVVGDLERYFDYASQFKERTASRHTRGVSGPEDEQSPVKQIDSEAVNSTQVRKRSYKEQKEYETIEANIHKLEAEQKQLLGRLEDSEWVMNHTDEMTAVSERLGELDSIIEETYLRWEELEQYRDA